MGRNGRAASELRDGRHPGVQGLDLQLQGGVRPRDRRAGDRRDEVRHQPVPRIGSAVLPRRVAHREGVLPEPTQAAITTGISTAGRLAGRSSRTRRTSSCAYEGTKENAELHDQRRRHVAAVRGHVPQQADRWTYNSEGRSPAVEQRRTCSSAGARRTSTGRSSRPAAARRRAPASTSRCRGSRPCSATPG